MKKLLLLVLTVVMLMCIAVLGTNAVNECAPGEHSIKTEVVDAGNGQSYIVERCEICEKEKWCAPGNHSTSTKTVNPDCDSQGYDVRYCIICGKDIAKENFKAPLGHIWLDNYVAAKDDAGDYYKNNRACTREKCGYKETESKVVEGKVVDVRYYLVQFFNAKATGGYLETITLKSGKTIGVKHAKLADPALYKTVPLCESNIFVSENGSYTYDGVMPVREKDESCGEYLFVGWTSNVTQDTDYEPEISTIDHLNPSVNNYEITIDNINENITYFACWKSMPKTYSVQFVNSNGESWISANNGQMQIPHGETIDYIWTYPSRKSTVSSDFEFIGWGCGDTKKKDSEGNYTQYDEYKIADLDNDEVYVHIKEVPIFSNDAFVAIHTPKTRVYKVQFDLNKNAGDPFVANVGFGEALNMEKSGENYKLKLNEENIEGTVSDADLIIQNEYRDNTYIYQFEKSFVTSEGHAIKSNSFSVPLYTLDADDAVYLEYATDTTERTMFEVNGKAAVLDLPDYEGDTFFDYFQTELEYYNFCMDINNKTVYEGRNFDLSKKEYFFLVSEHGDYLYDANGNRVCLEVSFNGIYRVDINGGRVKFTSDDAKALRLVKVEPEYRSIVRLYPFTVEIAIPLEIDGKTTELLPEDYISTMVVQVKNENGHLLARGYSGYKFGGNSYAIKEDAKGNKYYHVYCNLTVQKAARYDISVASTDEKYEGNKSVYWEVYSTMYDNGNNTMKTNIIVDASIRDGYNQNVNCYCLCHGPLKGLWVRILNILYSLFKVKYECCPHMHAELGGDLAY